MRKISITLAGVLLAALLIAGSLNLRPAAAQTTAQATEDAVIQRTIRVTGSGVAVTQPDTAVVVIGVRTEAEEASAALDQNSQQMTALINALRQAGLAQADIQTTNINLTPRYSNQPSDTGQAQVNGYIASNTVQARISGVDRVGAILDAAVQEGGNLIESIYFEVSDPTAAQRQAREAAFNNAREKAEELADLAGVQIGRLVSISETTSFVPLAAGLGRAEAAADLAVPVEGGTQNIQINLEVTWEITGGQALVPRTGDETATATATAAAATSTAAPSLTATRPAVTATAAPTSTESGTVPTVAVTPLDETATPDVDTTGTPESTGSLGSAPVEALRAQGAEVNLLGSINQPFFPATGRIVEVNGEQVQVFTFESAADAQQAARTLSQTNSQLRALAERMLGSVHFYQEGNTIVMYAGNDAGTLDLLTRTFGDALGE